MDWAAKIIGIIIGLLLAWGLGVFLLQIVSIYGFPMAIFSASVLLAGAIGFGLRLRGSMEERIKKLNRWAIKMYFVLVLVTLTLLVGFFFADCADFRCLPMYFWFLGIWILYFPVYLILRALYKYYLSKFKGIKEKDKPDVKINV